MKQIMIKLIKILIVVCIYFLIIQWNNTVFGASKQVLEDGKYAIKAAIDVRADSGRKN